MSNTDYADYPDIVKRLSIKKLSEFLLDFKHITPDGVQEMYNNILTYMNEDFTHNPESPDYNV